MMSHLCGGPKGWVENEEGDGGDEKVQVCQRDASVRVRIVGMRIDANDIFCIGTIKDDYLGLIDFGSGGL